MSDTLYEALTETYMERWANTRSASSMLIQAERAIAAVAFLKRPEAMLEANEEEFLKDRKAQQRLTKTLTVEDIDKDSVRKVARKWRGEGLAPATINKRLVSLSAMGIKFPGMYVKNPKVLKWWLRPDEELRAIAWLEERDTPRSLILADFIAWTTRTGLRVEESLRLTRADIDVKGHSFNVPGLKTSISQATLPLGAEAQEIAERRMLGSNRLLFPINYPSLLVEWNLLRAAMGWDDHMATLKALRRSAARYLHVDCKMPLDMVRHYLRHENIKTTMEYLRLTGGYGTEEMRMFLR